MAFARRYLFDSMVNFRDLGGWTGRKGVTRHGWLFRSDLPWHLTEADRARIRELGIGVSLDLRDEPELTEMPDELRDLPGVEHRPIPMLGVEKAKAQTRPGRTSAFDPSFFWGAEYIRMLEDNRPWAKTCVEFLAGEERNVVFHCFTGKDRTGILSALVLGCCGVSREDIAADYSVSQIYLRPVYEWMRRHIPDFHGTDGDSPFYSTAAANILAVTDHLDREYGGVRPFLRQCGAGEDTLDALEDRLIKRT